MAKRRRTFPSSRRIRTLKAEFWTDPEIAKFSFRCRLTYGGLICAYADDYGRELDDVRSIKAAIWLHDDEVTLEDIAEDLTTLNVAGRIVRYDDTTSGQRGLRQKPSEKHLRSRQRYLFIVNWKKHQKVDKPTPSKFPPPPATSRIAREQSRLALDLPETGSGFGSGLGEGEGSGFGSGEGARGGTKTNGNGRVAHEVEPEDPKAEWEAVKAKLAEAKAMPS